MSDFRWSFSQWETYNQCPAKWNYASVMRLPRQPPGPAASRGLDMHDRCERYIKGEIPLSTALYGTGERFGSKGPAKISLKYASVLDQFKEHPNGDRHTELEISLDREWYLCGGSLTNKKAFVNGFMDAVRVLDGVAHVGEWKSGQPKPTHKNQRELYALFSLRKFLGIEQVIVTTYYLEDTHPPQQLAVKATAEDKLKTIWMQRAEGMENDKICAPRPNDGCKWCDFRKSLGGPCEFGA